MADVLRAALIDDGIVGIKSRRQKTRYVAAMPKLPAEAWRGSVRRFATDLRAGPSFSLKQDGR